jgi:hypothetical protein
MIPKEIYTLGAVRFNTQPLAQLKGQLLAKKAAKEEALNKYFTDLQGKINTAGVRTKDLKLDPKNPASPGILTDIENWQKDWSANRESISKGGLAQQEHLNKFNEIVRKIQQSKDRVKNLDEVSKLKQQGKINEEDLPIIDKIDASIYDPKGYKEDGVTEYGIGDFSEFVPTWDVPKIKQFVDYAAAGMEPAGKADEKTIIDPYTKRKVTTFDKVYTQDQLMKMAEKAIAIESDKGGYKTFNKILQEGERDIPSDQFISLAKAYNIVSPNDIMDTPLKVAAASIVLNKMGVAGRGETSYARPRDTNINLGGDGGKQFVDYYGEIEGKLRTPVTIGKPGAPKEQRIEGYPVNKLSAITQDRIIDIAKKLTGEDYAQGDLLIQRNPKDKLIYLSFVDKDDATGLPISVTQLVPLTKQDINLEPQVSVKEKREAASEAAFPAPKTGTAPTKQNTYVIKGKTYSEKDLINMGYTLDQIKPYIKK